MAAILVAGTILFLLLLDWGARRLRGGAAEPEAASAPSVWADPSGLLPVAGTFLSPAHLWARIAEDGSVRLGVDAFARKAMGGDPTFLLPRPGHRVEKGDELLATVRGDGRLGFPSPFSGTVRAVRFPCPLDALKDGYNSFRIGQTDAAAAQQIVWVEIRLGD